MKIVTGSYDYLAMIWDVKKGALIGTLKGHTDKINCVCFSHDSKRIVTGSDD